MNLIGIIISVLAVTAGALILWAAWMSLKNPNGRGRSRFGSSDGYIYTGSVGDAGANCTTDGGGGCGGD
ncbi:MAG: hypothetical protein HY457_00720 [Parcubacteria group bacterium]|nr:hypothetical protein [Parcubacteria group bacterium]